MRQAMIAATAMPSYIGGKPTNMVVAANLQGLTTNAAGLGTVTVPISFAGVSNYAARFGVVFDEVRVLGAKVTLNPLTSSTGMTAFFWNEKQPPFAATSTIAQQRNCRWISNSNGAGTGYVMHWKSDGFLDLSWDSLTGSGPTSLAYFTMFTDASLGTPAAVNQLWIAQIELTVQFRGLSSQ